MTSKLDHAAELFDVRTTKDVYNLKPHPVTGRLIDSHPGVRTRPMKYLCLGFSRTGTMSLFKALQQLGFHPYHMVVAMGAPKTNLGIWQEALNAKYHGIGKKYGREEFDKILGDYDGVADVPCVLFAEELIAAYPEAKIVITSRDVDAWLRSMDGSAGAIYRWRSWELVAPWDKTLAAPFWAHAKTLMPIAFRTFNDFSPHGPARAAFFHHYDVVRTAAPKERTLEYQVGQGWQPLCDFLGVPVPDHEYPRVNDQDQFVLAHSIMWWLALGKMVGKIGLMVGVPAAGAVAAVMWQRGTLPVLTSWFKR